MLLPDGELQELVKKMRSATGARRNEYVDSVLTKLGSDPPCYDTFLLKVLDPMASGLHQVMRAVRENEYAYGDSGALYGIQTQSNTTFVTLGGHNSGTSWHRDRAEAHNVGSPFGWIRDLQKNTLRLLCGASYLQLPSQRSTSSLRRGSESSRVGLEQTFE